MITIKTFGYRNGKPKDLDGPGVQLVDCRGFRNPHNNQELRPLNGTNVEVQAYVKKDPRAMEALRMAVELVLAGSRPVTTLVFGCLGGKHRSVALAEMAASKLTEMGVAVRVEHREI